ncbi:MAG: ABC transporter permease [Bacteroidota bacterium]
MIRNYFIIALRNLTRNKVYSSINVIGLSIGLAAAMLILLYGKDEISFDQFHANNPNIYRVVNQAIEKDGSISRRDGNSGHFQGPKFKAGIPEIEEFVRIRSDFRNLKKGTEIIGEELFQVDPSFFNVFTFPMMAGDPQTALLKPNSIVISEEMAKKYFGNTDVLNKTIELIDVDKVEPFIVTGITKKCPQNSSIKFDLLIPQKIDPNEMANNENWFNFFQNTFVKLIPNADQKKVEAKMKKVFETDSKVAAKAMAEKYGITEKNVYLLQPFTAMHLDTEYIATNGLKEASNPMYSYILSGIALFILIIACINFITLTVARSVKRAKEIGVRKVVGGDRKQLILQFLGESFLLCLISFLLAIIIVQFILPTFNELANKALSIVYLFDIQLVVIYILMFLVTVFLSGFYPALVLSGYSPVQTLYGRFNLSGKNYLQKSLVVFQFSLASFLIIATITIYAQFNFLTSKSLGYDDKNLIMVNKQRITKAETKLFIEKLKENPNIIEVAPKNGGGWGTIAKADSKTEIQFAYETVNPSYIPMLKIQILKGRNFSLDFTTDSTKSVIINEAFAKKAGWKEPLGKIVDFWYNPNEKYTVIGVVKDYHYESLTQEIKPQLFTMKPGNQYGMVNIKIRPKTEVAALKHIEKTFKSLFPIASYEYKFKDLENIKSYESEAKWKQIILLGAILTIFISCIGLFGLATLSAEKRTKEIGIRKVLGASVSNIVQLLSTDFIKLISISFLFSFPAAYYGSYEWLKNYPYRIDINVWIFVFTAIITILISIITVGWQSVRAALMNPVKSLKTE